MAAPWIALQQSDHHDLVDRTTSQYKEINEAFFEERRLIPNNHLHDIRFEELEKDPVGQVGSLYRTLDLPDFGHVEPRLRRYAASLSGYKKNRFPEISTELRQRIAREWQQCFNEWDYPV
jgi:hypothetical protein